MILKLGCLTTVVISSLEAAKEVLRTHDHVLSYQISTDPVRAVGHHELSFVWLPPFSHWRFLKKIMTNQLFSTQRLDASKKLRMEKVQELMSFVNKHSEKSGYVNISRALFVTTLNIISNALFSTNLANFDDCKTTHEFHDAVVRMMEIAGKPNVVDFFPFLGFLDLQGTRKEARLLMNKLFKVFQGFIDRKRSSSNFSRNNNNMLDFLLDIAQENESKLDDSGIKHFLLREQARLRVQWNGLWQSYFETMVKAQEEIEKVIGQNDVVEESDILKLTYLQAVVKETLRLYPAPFLVPRKSKSADVRIFEFFIPKNTHVFVNIWVIGRDPNVWENPKQFEPERFLRREINVKGNNFELIPFGAGQRICPGTPLAFRTMHLLLAFLLHGLSWKYQDGVIPQDMDMSEAFGSSLHKAKPLCALPIKKRV